ncbi:DEAD/DEAH box helicase [Ectobacillus funiculus]|uniref:DEAD/DEAH box helicase n=1 Tax=Ectobacillus funiculus TaxID=137993 RepID=A0ABV5WD74_9BACI
MYSAELCAFLEGRRLLPGELPFSEELLRQHQREGVLAAESSVKRVNQGYHCTRCGNGDPLFFARFSCSRCQTICTYCRRCIMMGRTSECTPLFYWKGPSADRGGMQVRFVWKGVLSDGQRIASEAVLHAIEHKEECLIWAVCGAGKTEMLFAGIYASLARGERVCIATPRTDVVLELEPRLRQVFTNIPIAALYGGSSDRHTQAPLTIATTHQLLRYFHAFDTIIIDEVDAFPYSADASLQYAVENAKKAAAAIIYVTATPNRRWKKEARAGTRKAVIIPVRYHRHPLPIPSFSWCGNWKGKLKRHVLPKNIMHWIEKHAAAGRPILLFVPHIRQVEPVAAILKQLDNRIEGVHAEDPLRKEKIRLFRTGDIPLLVTTTILERGVTITDVQVAVLGAEENVFTESALVQIAGRAGRNAAYPKGDVIYFHYGKTEEMAAARRHIETMNKEAKRKGWLV